MSKETVVAIAVIAFAVIGYLAWQYGEDNDTALDAASPQATAPANAPTANPAAATPQNAQSEQKN